MLRSKYQRVGALAGLLLFFGAWLTAYYNNWVWALLTISVTLFAFWVALEEESVKEAADRVKSGFFVGLIAGAVARIMGLLAMIWAFGGWTNPTSINYESLADVFRIVLNGELWVSLLLVLGSGLVGSLVAYVIPYFVAEREEE